MESESVFSLFSCLFKTESIKLFHARISNLIVPAILENSEISSSGMQGQKSIQRSTSGSDSESMDSYKEKELHTLIKELSNVATMFRIHKVEDDFVFQFFRQVS